MTTKINNLSAALDYAKNNNATLRSGYSIERANGSEECTAIFNSKKGNPHLCLDPFDHSRSHLGTTTEESIPSCVEERNITQRNITLWHKTDGTQGEFKKIILKTIYIFLSVLSNLTLPLADWAIGHLRRDEELKSVYRKNTDPSQLITNSKIVRYRQVS